MLDADEPEVPQQSSNGQGHRFFSRNRDNFVAAPLQKALHDVPYHPLNEAEESGSQAATARVASPNIVKEASTASTFPLMAANDLSEVANRNNEEAASSNTNAAAHATTETPHLSLDVERSRGDTTQPMLGNDTRTGNHTTALISLTDFADRLHIAQALNDEAETAFERRQSGTILWIIALLLLLEIFSLGFLILVYRDSWNLNCDYTMKVYSLSLFSVWLCSDLISFIKRCYKHNRSQTPFVLDILNPLLYFGRLITLSVGFRVVYSPRRCPKDTIAYQVALSLLWAGCALYLIPFCLIFLLLLCIIIIVQFFGRPPNINNFTVATSSVATPRDFIQRMEVKPFKDLNRSWSRNHTSGPNHNDAVDTSPDSEMCSICMIYLQDEDLVTLMPCDQRHFFHKNCVELWLETSQICPICRANVVDILNNGTIPQAAGRQEIVQTTV